MRNWNLGVHIDRIHKGEFNPCHKKRGITFYDSTRKLGINSKSLLPNFEANGPIEPSGTTSKFIGANKRTQSLGTGVFNVCN